MRIYQYLKKSQFFKLTLLVAIFMGFILFYAIIQINKLKIKLSETESLSMIIPDIYQNYKNSLAQIKGDDLNKITQLENVRPSLDEILVFINEIEREATNFQKFELKHIGGELKINPEKTQSNSVKYALTAQTDYLSLIQFLKKIEDRLPYLVDIQNISFKQDDSANNLQLSLSLFIK